MASLLEVQHLVKKYGALTAVDDVSFAIGPGTCFGLLGPNGAGKTTTLEVIENILAPTSGDILYRGRPRTNQFKNEVGIQFQNTSLLAMLTVWETLQIFKGLYEETEDLDVLVDQCQLQEFKHQRHEKLSGGQRQRFLLALALVNRPHLVFLDEPSTGLDPQARHNLWHIVNTIKASGKTIVLTTHYMEEAQHLCDEVAIMDHGRIIARGAPEALIRTHCHGVTVVLPRRSFKKPLTALPLDLKEINGAVHIQTSNIDACLKQLLSCEVDLSDMSVNSPNLEHVFLNLTGRHLRD